MGIYLIVALIAHLLGSIPLGYILLRVFRGEDVRAIGSGNIGATNVARKAPGLGIATLILDAMKGFAAVAFAAVLRGGDNAFTMFRPGPDWTGIHGSGPFLQMGIAAVFAILGHV